ncbi:hypothetical protein [Formosa haliotis]|uniref:hypothetical protein n=1 Tax=Formosa haliotis TaxID=1555194 RepID=UPI0008249FD0|nr:hypothetical protein [Formosa haliotis]
MQNSGDVFIDNNTPLSYSISTQGRSATWKENVLRNSAVTTIPYSFTSAGIHHIKVGVNQTGIVIDYIEIIKN